jgi:ribosomal protein L40E
MSWSQIGILKGDFLPKGARFFFVSDCPELHYNSDSLNVLSPPDAMPSNRPNLTLDEQSFQGLLSAAFIIQQHNDRRRLDQQAQVEAELEDVGREDINPEDVDAENVGPEHSVDPAHNIVCPNCGAPKAAEGSQCDSCGVDELRPGERLQRNWASMWLKSQEQGLWPEVSPETKRNPSAHTARDFAPPNILAAADTDEVTREVLGKAALEKMPSETKWATAATENEATENEATENETTEDFHFPSESVAPEDSELTVQPFQLSAGDDAPANDSDVEDSNAGERSIDATGTGPSHLLQRLADLRVTLRFRRADLYLGTAVFVAALALLWPAAGVPRPAALGPWERALVMLGIAEAPAPVVHLQGDPGIEVWVDPHTALYYCPGEEPYGKTPNGRLANQREAQMDRFEPASRSACE